MDNDIDERNNDDDNNGYLVDGVIIHSDQPSPIITAAIVRGLPTPITVSSFDNKDVGVKPTVDDGPIVAAAEGILRLPSNPKVSQSRCCLVLLGSFSVFGGRMGQNWREINVCATILVSRLVFCHTNNVSLRSSFISRYFFVLIPIGQKQLDPDAFWISVIFSFTFPPEVFATYVAHFLLLLETLPIESHVKGLDNVTSISTLLVLDPNLQEELHSAFFQAG